jgi:hypothetical protein
VYLESCTHTNIQFVDGANFFIGLVDRCFSSPVPHGICLDERKKTIGRFLAVYGINDTWQPQADVGQMMFCGMPIRT